MYGAVRKIFQISIPALITVSKASVFSWHDTKLPTREQTSTSSKYVHIAKRFVAL